MKEKIVNKFKDSLKTKFNKFVFLIFIIAFIASFFIGFSLQMFFVAAVFGLQFIDGFETKPLIYLGLAIFLGSMLGNSIIYMILGPTDLYMH